MDPRFFCVQHRWCDSHSAGYCDHIIAFGSNQKSLIFYFTNECLSACGGWAFCFPDIFSPVKTLFMNIIETVQKNLGYDALEKIDPNTQDTPQNLLGSTALAQAGIPAILIGLYSRLEMDPDISQLNVDQKGSMLENIFGKTTDAVIGRIKDYSKLNDNLSDQELEHIAREAARIVKEKIGGNAGPSAIRNFVARNKPDALLYLPPSLDLGTLLKNNSLDDRTGKMEGPLSSLMHNLEKTFNTSGGSE
jgi:hypothetical protein